MGKVQFGVIGTGRAYRLHRDADRGSDSVRYRAVFCRSFENAQKAAAEYREGEMKAYASLEEMLASDIDAVMVLAPPGCHEKLVVQCAKAGKHVLCETPMAVTVEACRRMTAVCRDAAVKFMIAENHRFLPAHVYMRDMVQQGLIGDVLMVRAYEGVNAMPGAPDPQSWKGAIAGGGVFMDMAVHTFAALEYILGSPCVKVTARMAKQAVSLPGKAEDNGAAIAHYGSGALADIMVSSSQRTPPCNSMEIFGTKGSILANRDWQRPVRLCSFDERMGENQQQWLEPEIHHGPFPEYHSLSIRKTDEYFARCILEDRAPEFTPEAAKNAVACVTAGYLSMIKNRPVETAEIEKRADEGGSKNILAGLAATIPIRGGAGAASTGVSK